MLCIRILFFVGDITIGKETLLLNNKQVTDLKNFEKHLPPLIASLCEELGKRGHHITVVGGIVRDYFLNGKVGHDWDMEITHETLAWEVKTWKELGKELGKLGRVTFLPYDVLKIESGNWVAELSPPRKETFTDESHHKNFTVSFDYRTPFSEGVKRRDFTINAIGLKLSSQGKVELIDPLNGLLHLHHRELHPCGEDFGRDPVRFLRAIRFSVKFNFKLSSELLKVMDGMNLQGISPSYLWGELQKSQNPLTFYQRLLNEKEKHPELKLPVENISKLVIKDTTRHDSWIIALEWEGIDSSNWQNFFGLSHESGRRLQRWAKVTKDFVKIMPEEFHGEFEVVREKASFDALFDWYFTTKQILQKNPELPLLHMIDSYLPQWGHLYKFEAPKDVKHIDPPFRAKYQVWNLCQRL